MKILLTLVALLPVSAQAHMRVAPATGQAPAAIAPLAAAAAVPSATPAAAMPSPSPLFAAASAAEASAASTVQALSAAAGDPARLESSIDAAVDGASRRQDAGDAVDAGTPAPAPALAPAGERAAAAKPGAASRLDKIDVAAHAAAGLGALSGLGLLASAALGSGAYGILGGGLMLGSAASLALWHAVHHRLAHGRRAALLPRRRLDPPYEDIPHERLLEGSLRSLLAISQLVGLLGIPMAGIGAIGAYFGIDGYALPLYGGGGAGLASLILGYLNNRFEPRYEGGNCC